MKTAPVVLPFAPRLTPRALFDWAVVRQSALGPGLLTTAEAFRTSTDAIRAAVAQWDDPIGHMEVVETLPDTGPPRTYRIEAYYNTSG